jgi:dipeptidyl aminopeptidase/acylaminoacyl peptidase
MIRHWDTWGCYKKRNHLFLCSLAPSSSGSLEAQVNSLQDMMFGWESDCPVRPFGGSEEYNSSPDGQQIVFTCRHTTAPLDNSNIRQQPTDMAWSTAVGVYSARVPELTSPSTHTATLTLVSGESAMGSHSSPCFSPDNRYIAFLSMNRAQYESDKQQVVFCEISSGQLYHPISSVDLSFSSIVFSPITTIAGETTYTLYSTAQYRGSYRLYSLGLTAPRDSASGMLLLGSVGVVLGDESRSAQMVVCPQGGSPHCVYFLESTLTTPNMLKMGVHNEIFDPVDPLTLHGPITEGARALLSSSPRHLQEIHCSCPEYFNGDLTLPQVTQFYFAAKDAEGRVRECSPGTSDEMVHMWYLPPAQMQADEDELKAPANSVPLILVIHGGPQGAFLNSWNYRWNLSFFASQGQLFFLCLYLILPRLLLLLPS